MLSSFQGRQKDKGILLRDKAFWYVVDDLMYARYRLKKVVIYDGL